MRRYQDYKRHNQIRPEQVGSLNSAKSLFNRLKKESVRSRMTKEVVRRLPSPQVFKFQPSLNDLEMLSMIDQVSGTMAKAEIKRNLP